MEEPYPLKKSLFAAAGEVDVENRYPSVVDIRTHEPLEAGIHGGCSGVLLSPRVVLTAGHCVCLGTPGQTGKSVIDGSHCSKTPTVKTLTDDPTVPESQSTRAYLLHTYEGVEVRPHPEFRVVLDERGHIESSKADLAVILLGKPVDAKVSPPALAETESAVGELFTMVSYTYDEVVGGIAGQRRISRYKIKEVMLPGSDQIVFEQPGRGVYKGDSGGPCLRVGSTGPDLIGVSSRGLGEVPTFTSTYPYRAWLRAEIAAATASE